MFNKQINNRAPCLPYLQHSVRTGRVNLRVLKANDADEAAGFIRTTDGEED